MKNLIANCAIVVADFAFIVANCALSVADFAADAASRASAIAYDATIEKEKKKKSGMRMSDECFLFVVREPCDKEAIH